MKGTGSKDTVITDQFIPDHRSTAGGVKGLLELDCFNDVNFVFDVTSAGAHSANDRPLRSVSRKRGEITMLDLTPAAIGPYVVSVVNDNEHLEARNVNMVTDGGQATVSIVSAINALAPVAYAEIVLSIASKSAGPEPAPTSMNSPRQRRVRCQSLGVQPEAKRSSC